jgi:hypothetical protein
MQDILGAIFGLDFKGTEKVVAGPIEGFKQLYELYQNT